MKKLALLLVVVFLGSAAFAALPVGKMGYGVQGLTLTSGALTMPTVQKYLDEETAVEIGLGFISQSGAQGSVSNFTLVLAMKKPLLKPIGEIYPHWGVGLAYTSNPALAANTTNLALVLNVGAQYFITPEFSIEGNLAALAINSLTTGAGTTTQISILNTSGFLPAAVVGAHLYI